FLLTYPSPPHLSTLSLHDALPISISISPGAESPVPAQILSPAPDLPVANLCSTQITVTANGNAIPLLCQSGAVNVPAWRFYADVDRKSTRLNSSHVSISYAVFCLK